MIKCFSYYQSFIFAIFFFPGKNEMFQMYYVTSNESIKSKSLRTQLISCSEDCPTTKFQKLNLVGCFKAEVMSIAFD